MVSFDQLLVGEGCAVICKETFFLYFLAVGVACKYIWGVRVGGGGGGRVTEL